MSFSADDEFSMRVVDVRQEVVRLRVRGKDFSEIADELNLPRLRVRVKSSSSTCSALTRSLLRRRCGSFS
jgi:DNA-binding NarL/FixJ family response regulator